jgi:hypothetical protein
LLSYRGRLSLKNTKRKKRKTKKKRKRRRRRREREKEKRQNIQHVPCARRAMTGPSLLG